MPSLRPITEEERRKAWELWLNGLSVSAVASRLHRSHAVARSILDGEPPSPVTRDYRYLHGCRYFWMAASDGFVNPSNRKYDRLVIVRTPRSFTKRAFKKAMMTIAAEFADEFPGVSVMPKTIEFFGDAADGAQLAERGYIAWSFDEKGLIARIDVPQADAPAAQLDFDAAAAA